MTNRVNNRSTPRHARTAILLAVVGVALLAGGCKKKTPPPVAPPPPPPPAPVSVDFKTVTSEVHPDPRVSVAPGISVTDESFARAAVRLADALVRGDENALRPMLTRSAQGVIDQLVADGTWSDLGKKFEGVRLVYAASPGGTPPDLETAIKQMLDANEREIIAFDRSLEAQGAEHEYRAKLVQRRREENERAIRAQTLIGATTSAVKADMVMLLAVQTPSGAELLGWTALRQGEAWTFANASTTAAVKHAATDWDGIGQLGFSLGTGGGERPIARPITTPPDQPASDKTGS